MGKEMRGAWLEIRTNRKCLSKWILSDQILEGSQRPILILPLLSRNWDSAEPSAELRSVASISPAPIFRPDGSDGTCCAR